MKKANGLRMRFAVMIATLAVIATGFFMGTGIGNACGLGFDALTLLCPLGALLAMISEQTAIPMAVMSIALALLVCIVLGKVACSWVCPVHFMSLATRNKDAQNKCGTSCKKSRGIKIDSRHGILAAALGSTLIFGFPVFCLVCPVGLTFATVLLIMRLFAFGATTWTIIVFPLIILIELLVLPKWCKNICPLGALLSLFSGLNRTLLPTVDAEECIRQAEGKACNLCEAACPEGINLHDIASGETTLNDCSKCRACSDICPKGAITFPFLPKREQQRTTPKGGGPSCLS